MKRDTKIIIAALLLCFVFVICGSAHAARNTRATLAALPMIEEECLDNCDSLTEPKTEPEAETETTTENQFVKITFEATAYCPCKKCCGKYAEGRGDIVRGASGERLISGVSVAIDPDIIPYGTKIYIDGKEYIAHDCGGAVKGNKIDFYFDSHEKALQFGRRTVIGYILKEDLK